MNKTKHQIRMNAVGMTYPDTSHLLTLEVAICQPSCGLCGHALKHRDIVVGNIHHGAADHEVAEEIPQRPAIRRLETVSRNGIDQVSRIVV